MDNQMTEQYMLYVNVHRYFPCLFSKKIVFKDSFTWWPEQPWTNIDLICYLNVHRVVFQWNSIFIIIIWLTKSNIFQIIAAFEEKKNPEYVSTTTSQDSSNNWNKLVNSTTREADGHILLTNQIADQGCSIGAFAQEQLLWLLIYTLPSSGHLKPPQIWRFWIVFFLHHYSVHFFLGHQDSPLEPRSFDF